tara:strand:- start:657 stop:2807 length:2151 start_codon:yes stop_codon:yes gene_type:complete
MQKRILCYAVACLLSLNVFSQYIYEDNQSLIDLTSQSGTTNLNASDDQVSSVFNLGFTFDFYGQPFTQGRMATNGCLHFKTTGAYCSDYRPDPLTNQYTYTLLPFWTDLIRDNGSKMLAKSFSDKTVFGWYNMREYNRASDNSIEVILWTNDTFEFRYGPLDIINHDVLIGEVGSGSSEVYQYLFHDECNVGSTNSSSCVNTNWNDTSFNTLLENGGSLYGVGTGNDIDCSNPLNNSSCSGYAAAYQTQQCDIDQLYSESCPYYWEAYDDLQCNLDPQYGPFCQGYRQEESVAYFVEEQMFDYGYEDSMTEYDTYEDEFMFEDLFFEPEYDTFEEPEFIFEEEIIFEQMFSYEEYYEPFEVMRELPMHEEELFMPIEDLMLDEFIFQETFLVEDYREPETFIELETIEELEEWFEEETRMEEELAFTEEPEEEFIEEVFEEEAVEEVFEEIEEMREEMEEERIAEVEEERVEELQEEEIVVGAILPEGKSSISREMALSVVSSTLNTAQASMQGTTSGNSIHATGGTTGASSVSSSNSGGGVSVSNSPSISEQFASSTAQNNQVLDMSSNITSSTSSTSVEVETVETTSVAVNTTPTQTLQSQIDVSVSTDASATEAEQTVANVIAQNLQAAQDDVQAKQEETGEYGSENTIIAYMGFVPNFNNYRLVTMPDQDVWYESTDIYANNMLSDNIEGFYQMAGQSLETLIEMRELQPPL